VATSFVRATIHAAESTATDPISAIDDLIKFRLVESMLRQPESPTTAGDLAAKLGFHSIDLTGMALDEMVGAGLLGASRRGGILSYALVADPSIRSEVADLVAKGPPGLFNRLAAGSVSRIKRLLRKKS
jgi:hypothetical protein